MAPMAQLKSRTQTPAPMAGTPAEPSYPPLPAPQNFDILPPLHALLSRLEPSLNTYTPDATEQSSNQPSTNSAGSSAASGALGVQPQLSYKDAAVAAQFLKTRIRRTLAELAALEDMGRTVAEQEVEISALEERINGQNEVLAKLGLVAGDMLEGLEAGERTVRPG